MEKLKLTVEQLKNYIGTGLKFHYQGEYDDVTEKPIEFKLTGVHESGWVDGFGKLQTVEDQWHIDDMFPIAYRLTDLDKFIPELGFVPLKRLLNDDPSNDDDIEIVFKGSRIENLSRFESYFEGDHISSFFPFGNQRMTPFEFMQKLFQWHFWPFGNEYFEQGLIIDKLKHTEQ